ncbi:hypothetical protein B0H12DRAFT_200734 [Mycena haematopus]|nr:hypothetical protein B0H12DRAFT_200734 [Mycena haematopus]
MQAGPSGVQSYAQSGSNVYQNPGASSSTMFNNFSGQPQMPQSSLSYVPRATPPVASQSDPRAQVSQSKYPQPTVYHQQYTSQSNSAQQSQHRPSPTPYQNVNQAMSQMNSAQRPSPTTSYPQQSTNQAASQSNSGQQTHYRPSPAPSYPQQNTNQAPNSGQQTQYRPSPAPSYAQQNTNQTQQAPPRPQPPSHSHPSVTPQPQSHSASTSQRTNQSSAPAPPRTGESQRQASAPQAQRAQSRPSVPPSQPVQGNAGSAGSQAQPQRAPSRPSVQPSQPNAGSSQSQPQPTQSTSRLSAAIMQNNALMQPNPLFQLDPSRKLSAATPTPAPAPTPSYGISPFAHNPAARTQSNSNIGANQHVFSVAPPTSTPVGSAAPAPAPIPRTTLASGKTNAPEARSEGQVLGMFLNLINGWQKSSPAETYMDIPHAHIRVRKFKSGEIHFLGPDPTTSQQVRLSPLAAFRRLRFRGAAVIYISPSGVNELLQEPVSDKVKATYTRFVGVAAKNAPEAKFSNPPLATPVAKRALPGDGGPAVRSPKDADKRFLAHDILRALGKAPQDDDRVRYAKRQAVEAPRKQEPPLVLQRISSNEPSAKSTPPSSESGSPSPDSPPPSVSVPVPAPVPRVPLFLPWDSSAPTLLTAPAKRRSARVVEVFISSPPPYVKRDLEKLRAQRRQDAMLVDETSMRRQEAEETSMDVAMPDVVMREESEEPSEPEISMVELKRRRALGMYQNTQSPSI